MLVRGSGDVGSAVAHALHLADWAVAIHDAARPAHARRGMAFCDALHAGRAVLEGVLGKRAVDRAALGHMLDCGKAIPLINGEFMEVLAVVCPDVLIDARMRKRALPERQRGLAPLTIGLGPNFVAGENVDLAVETAWGERLGVVLASGGTQALAGEPAPIEGHARDRYVYAPAAGVFETVQEIGDEVEAGTIVAHIGALGLAAPIAGRLRGLTRSGVCVEAGAKVIEVDPRGERAQVHGLGARPRRIAQGVLQALQAR